MRTTTPALPQSSTAFLASARRGSCKAQRRDGWHVTDLDADKHLQHELLHGLVLVLVALRLSRKVPPGKQNHAQRLLAVRLHNTFLQLGLKRI